MTSDREVKPTVGLIPTTLFTSAGLTMEPEVSVPRLAKARPREVATAEPDELPDGSWKGAYAPRVWPPYDDHPLEEFVELNQSALLYSPDEGMNGIPKVGPLSNVCLAKDDRASLTQFGDDGGISRDFCSEQEMAACRVIHLVCSCDIVFE